MSGKIEQTEPTIELVDPVQSWRAQPLVLRAGRRRCGFARESSPLESPLVPVSAQYSGSPWLPALLPASSAKSSEKPELESVSACGVGVGARSRPPDGISSSMPVGM